MALVVVCLIYGTAAAEFGRICTSMYLSCQKKSLWYVVGFAKIPLCSSGLFLCVPCLDDPSTADLCNKTFKACEGQCIVRGTDDKCYSAEGEADCLP
ncbi:hypothetical protein [Candidatus Magnetominusculus xianensis]|uniref:Secreted protein n=1 Tax=Candidatus Magnetominusculus xianensis TaxID=1748249 RepID=A0ABR5SEP3_9BACT|nr:hypothetical protein [Candidatus Magnetominusculus xianensis]KWT84444.1 hypothetical protein ASN18_1941 [Candidatus Magnetominusculus xianensis]MBF0404278.1 hypothetical protein [Nitrospirota bacterium]